MITKAIIQFVYLNSNNLSSDFRHCGTSNSLIFSSTSYESYSDADKGARDEGFEVLTTQHSSRLWNNFEQPLTTEAGDGVEIVKTISWMSSRISKPSQQIENPFWVISKSTQRVLIMAKTIEEASQLHRKAMGIS